MGLRYDPPAETAVRALLDDDTRRALREAVVAALRYLDAHAGDARCRRRSYGDLGWGMPVRTRHEEWLIIWEPGPDGVSFVRYVGPEP